MSAFHAIKDISKTAGGRGYTLHIGLTSGAIVSGVLDFANPYFVKLNKEEPVYVAYEAIETVRPVWL